MKRLICLLLGMMCLGGIYAQNEEETLPYREGIDPEFLTSLKSRFDVTIGVGYTSIKNQTNNAKLETFNSHFNNLKGGIKAEAGFGYNVTSNFHVGLNYAYRGTSENNVFAVWNEENNVSETVYLEDSYRFNEITTSATYRIGVAGERLKIVPQAGAGVIFFHNEGQFYSSFTQKSSGWTVNGGLGLDYLASDIIAIGLTSQYTHAILPNTDLEFSSQADVPFEVDDRFGFLDVQLRFYLFF